jgi:hypothetical protein
MKANIFYTYILNLQRQLSKGNGIGELQANPALVVNAECVERNTTATRCSSEQFEQETHLTMSPTRQSE